MSIERCNDDLYSVKSEQLTDEVLEEKQLRGSSFKLQNEVDRKNVLIRKLESLLTF